MGHIYRVNGDLLFSLLLCEAEKLNLKILMKKTMVQFAGIAPKNRFKTISIAVTALLT